VQILERKVAAHAKKLRALGLSEAEIEDEADLDVESLLARLRGPGLEAELARLSALLEAKETEAAELAESLKRREDELESLRRSLQEAQAAQNDLDTSTGEALGRSDSCAGC